MQDFYGGAYAEMPAGSAIVYQGSTIGGGGFNTIGQPRTGVHMSAIAGRLRTEENDCLSIMPALASMMLRLAPRLFGYPRCDASASAGGYLGTVGLYHRIDPGSAAET
ncbi:MAG: hypothetical protein ACI9TF_000267 [Paracrocinitomix sp.]|jgi:hypothetical protein